MNLWTWADVPAGTAYVTYDDGDQHLWQRPIARVVMFPDVSGNDEVAIAHSADGTVLERVDRASLDGAGPVSPTLPSEVALMTQAQSETVNTLNDSTMRDCLTSHGGAFPPSGDVATFSPDVEQAGVWADCVQTTITTVAAAVAALDVPFRDLATEPPSADRPPAPDDQQSPDVTIDAVTTTTAELPG